MQITRLAAEDAPAYRSLMLEAYARDPGAFTSTADERAALPEAWWERRIAGPEGLGLAFGAWLDGALAGAVALEFSARPKTRHKALLIGMYVRPAARRRGAARALMEAALTCARERPGLRLLTLTVTEGNQPAITLYRGCGLRAFGTEPLAIRTDAGLRARVHMALELPER